MSSQRIPLIAVLLGCSINFPAAADEWGCQVLLCLSNPAGPMAVAACVPPIQRLYDQLRRRRPFPTCEMASGAGGGSWAQAGFSHYDLCPPGTLPLDEGVRAIVMPDPANPYSDIVVHLGIGTGDGIFAWNEDGPIRKTCVGSLLNRAQRSDGDGGFQQMDVYDRVVSLSPQGSPNIIDVYVDGVLVRRVRW